MTQTVTFPSSAFNNIPGVSGVQDVQFEVLTIEDLDRVVQDNVPTLNDIQDRVETAIENQKPVIEEAVDDAIGQVGTPAAEAVADAILDALDVRKGLFGPLDDPLDVVIQTAVEEAIDGLEELDLDLTPSLPEELTSLPERVGEIQTTLEEIQTAVSDETISPEDLSVPTLEEIRQNVADELEDRIENLPGGTLLTDPDEFVDNQLARLERRLVSEEASQDLQDAIDNL